MNGLHYENIKWLRECAEYFERRDTGGEDMAHWANVANAETARKIADEYARLATIATRL